MRLEGAQREFKHYRKHCKDRSEKIAELKITYFKRLQRNDRNRRQQWRLNILTIGIFEEENQNYKIEQIFKDIIHENFAEVNNNNKTWIYTTNGHTVCLETFIQKGQYEAIS